MEPGQDQERASATLSASRLDAFFSVPGTPSREQCDKYALSITGHKRCRAASAQGCQSYTLICEGRPRSMKPEGDETWYDVEVVQFRLGESRLNLELIKTARVIHGDIVPETWLAAPLGNLLVYVSEMKAGLCPRDLAPTTSMMKKSQHGLLEKFMEGLAQYFKSCWVSKLDHLVHPDSQDTRVVRTWDRMQLLRESPTGAFVGKHIELVEQNMAYVHEPSHGQILMHGDLNLTNFLVDPATFEINGLVDWASAKYEQFGYELYIVQMSTGYNTTMENGGFVFYNNHKQLKRAFWKALFKHLRIESLDEQALFKETLRPAWRLGLILREAFVHSADGRITNQVVVPSPDTGVQLLQLQRLLDDEDDFFELPPAAQGSMLLLPEAP
ncbi:uncharacterized protein J3D65DRAFT_700489 [Phyllosticta citribraziliensis]|uniref:Aminoglycoside phosphotransferase domain-containing protein n=1 Tax=Phyllosticta citribraziliensis TaxID=989973 RepID=A0ABR1LFH9_9PEZI